MIKTENFTVNGHDYVRTYSDSGFMIHGGFPEADYAEVIDPAEFNRIYTETDIPVETEEADAEEIVDILLGEVTE